ncbi:hypothetical protein [Methylobacterium sp. CM6257]
MTEMHNTRFYVLDAMAAVEREISHRLGFGPSRSLTMTKEETMQARAEAAAEKALAEFEAARAAD